jgi:hypothetical protein
MTTELQTAGKIDDLAQRIIDSHRDSLRFKTETIHAGRQAVLMAIQTGALLCKAKRLVGHGHWEKWFDDHVKDQAGFSIDTAKRWMTLSKRAKMVDLKSTSGLCRAYVEAQIIADTKEPLKPTGTGEVDIVEEALAGIIKRVDSALKFVREANPETWSPERQEMVRCQIEPIVKLYHKLSGLPHAAALTDGLVMEEA